MYILKDNLFFPALTRSALRAPGLLLADSALRVGRRGEDFLTRRPSFFFFTKTAITRERKVKKSFPTWEMNRLSEGYKRAVDQNWGHVAKIGFLGETPIFRAQKKRSLLGANHVLQGVPEKTLIKFLD